MPQISGDPPTPPETNAALFTAVGGPAPSCLFTDDKTVLEASGFPTCRFRQQFLAMCPILRQLWQVTASLVLLLLLPLPI